MNWDAVGALGEVLGSIAVFLTLGYLAVQVRHARDQVRHSISQNSTGGNRDLFLARAMDDELLTLNVRVNRALGGTPTEFETTLMERVGLTAEEASALHWEQMAWWQQRLQIIPYLEQRSTEERAGFDFATRRIYSATPVSRLWYECNKATLRPDAVRYVDALLAK
jgi:hypothetical protein